ncbi:transposase [Pseudomonas sp. MAP12]|uniref:Transposase n=1 Tax=Geopseudomonas aromaticivorans TaxID=2849492 RepID=A0ABS6MSS8_9GAMM|nr:transposase [Pseudomonas aromaticivorans]MBV2131857.1 transposase [Pseudomonas aromaticivorans]
MRKHYSPQVKKRLVLEVVALEDEGLNTAEACVRLGLSRANFYRWRGLIAETIKGGAGKIAPKSKRPKILARQTPNEFKNRIVEMALSGIFKSANAISKELHNERVIHPGTVIKILEEAGLYGVQEVRDSKGDLVKKKRGIIRQQGS